MGVNENFTADKIKYFILKTVKLVVDKNILVNLVPRNLQFELEM